MYRVCKLNDESPSYILTNVRIRSLCVCARAWKKSSAHARQPRGANSGSAFWYENLLFSPSDPSANPTSIDIAAEFNLSAKRRRELNNFMRFLPVSPRAILRQTTGAFVGGKTTRARRGGGRRESASGRGSASETSAEKINPAVWAPRVTCIATTLRVAVSAFFLAFWPGRKNNLREKRDSEIQSDRDWPRLPSSCWSDLDFSQFH